MVTLAAKVACDYIKNKTGADFILESGFNSDKKASARNMIMGRGHSVIAETTITNSVIRRILKADTSEMEKMQRVGPTITRLAGTEGCNMIRDVLHLRYTIRNCYKQKSHQRSNLFVSF